MEGWGRIDGTESNSNNNNDKRKPSDFIASWQRLWSQPSPVETEEGHKNVHDESSVVPEADRNTTTAASPQASDNVRRVPFVRASTRTRSRHSSANYARDEEDGILSPVSTPTSTPRGTPQKENSHYFSYRGSLLDRIAPPQNQPQPSTSGVLCSLDHLVDLATTATTPSPVKEEKISSNALDREDQEDIFSEEEEPEPQMEMEVLLAVKKAQNEENQEHVPLVTKLQPVVSLPADKSRNLLDLPSPSQNARKPASSNLFYRPSPIETAKIVGIASDRLLDEEEEDHSLTISDSDMGTHDTNQDEGDGVEVVAAGIDQTNHEEVKSTSPKSVTAKLQRFFRRVKNYEAFAAMDDQDTIDKNISVHFSSTDMDDNETLSTNASSLLMGTSALARHFRKHSQKMGPSSLDDTATNCSPPLADINHTTPSLVFLEQSTVGDTDSDGIAQVTERGLEVQLNTGDTSEIEQGSLNNSSPHDDTMSTSCLMPATTMIATDLERSATQQHCDGNGKSVGKVAIMKTDDPNSTHHNKTRSKWKHSRKRVLARRVIRVSALILVLSSLAAAILILTKRLRKLDDGERTTVSALGTSQYDTAPIPSTAPSTKGFSSPSATPVSLPTTSMPSRDYRATMTRPPSTRPTSLPTSTRPTRTPPTSLPTSTRTPSTRPTSLPTSTGPTSTRPTSLPTSTGPTTVPNSKNITVVEQSEQYLNAVLASSVGLWGGQQAMLEEGTYQNKALKWLASDPNLSTYSEETIVQRYGLAVLSFAMEGSDSSRRRRLLIDNGDECGWSESICDENGKLRILDWSGHGLENSIPPELGLLVNLKKINLSGNSLVGGIPRSIGALVNLEVLNLKGNFLSNPLPWELSWCSNLVDLDLSENEFTMGLPDVISEMKGLRYLRLVDNAFQGPIPEGYYGLTELVILDLSKNQLSGSIGTGITNLSNLVTLNLNRNRMSSFSDEIGSLSELQILDLGDNMISHHIPKTIRRLGKATSILLSQNMISGNIPDFSSTLQHLDLSDNLMSGYIPYTLGDCVNLKTLRLNSNFFSGGVTFYLKYLVQLEVLRIDSNDLRGKVPREVCKELEGIDFQADCPGKVDCKCCSKCSVEERPARGEKPSVQRPARGGKPSVQRPARGEKPSVQRPARGEKPSVQRPARGEKPSVQRPT